MVLATIIRLEMAYPGVGILAGDNAQYLSIVTAHGVIMVFFMAMPMLFGFFGNFLLPTQMGVHDVAFPRMNSAAFWFLPASLLALCQLVCVDRRYQRMNCFNIRELQGLLRNRFFEELIPAVAVTDLNHNTAVTLKNLRSFTLTYSIEPEYSVFGLSGLIDSVFNPFFRTLPKTTKLVSSGDTSVSFLPAQLPAVLSDSLFFQYLYGIIFFANSFVFDFFRSLLLLLSSLFCFLSPTGLFASFRFFFSTSWTSNVFTSLLFVEYPVIVKVPSIYPFKLKQNNMNYGLVSFTDAALDPQLLSTLHVSTSNLRKTHNDNPEILYKIKTGNYLPDELTRANFSFLSTSINFKSISGIKGDWWDSRNTLSLFNNIIRAEQLPSYFSFIYFFSKPTCSLSGDASPDDLINKSKLADLLITQDLHSLLFSQAKQVRLLNNWRSLRLSREGWRCRLLAARHQRSLFRRYVNENELIWVVERNAKDLLPGWAMITPFASRTRYTLVGKTDIGIAIVTVTLIASMISSANFLMTYRYLSTLNNRKMRDARSFFTESVIVASWMMIAANPMLILGLLMLLSDRHWKTSFFDYSGGGDTILFQHMFWFFGHPEVYIIIIPCFGFTNTLISFYLRKRISARASLLYSLYTIAFLGFFVWGHHMYMVGLAHTTRMLYSTLTVMISVPAATKIMHWLVTFVNSAVHFELPFVLSLFFIFYFVSGGISGMAVAHTGMSILFHDTFYVIGHFHVMLAGSLMFAGFAAFYFYLPSLFGVRYSRIFAYLHIFYYSVGQLFTVIPMIWLGYLGMPRRVLDYPAALGGWHSLVSSAHMITVSGILAFVVMLFDSLRKQKAYTIKTFGVGRYNTRLNFYLYQVARNNYWLSKHFALLPIRMVQHSKNLTTVHNLEYLDSSAFYYSFKPRAYGKDWLYL